MTPKGRETSASPDGADEVVVSPPASGGPAEGDDDAASAAARSLFEDVEVLIKDGKTYLEAELNFQKTRARFAADRLKWTVAFGSAALVFAFLAAIGLTVGLIIALIPLLTAWGATALVVLVLGAIAALAGRAALRRVKELAGAFGSGTGMKR